MGYSELSATQRDELVTSLAVLAVYDADAELSADNISAAVTASGNKVNAYMPQIFADLINRGLAVDKFLAGPSAGGAAAGGAAAGAAAGGEAAEEAAAEEEEEEMDLGGGMDMFGGGEDY